MKIYIFCEFLLLVFESCYSQLIVQTRLESVIVRGAIGASNDCGEYRKFGFVDDYKVSPCVSKANSTCPVQTVRANDPAPMYTTTIHYGPTMTLDYWSERWGLWLVTDETTNTATISLKLESKNDNWDDWCQGKAKFCYWKNYTITACGQEHATLEPIASFIVSPDTMNDFPTMDTFDVFLQPNCSVRCGVAGLGCCDVDSNAYAVD